MKQADIDDGKGADVALTSEELAGLHQLRRENRVLKQERAFLEKAAAFFAKEQDRPSS